MKPNKTKQNKTKQNKTKTFQTLQEPPIQLDASWGWGYLLGLPDLPHPLKKRLWFDGRLRRVSLQLFIREKRAQVPHLGHITGGIGVRLGC
jgi:hypothetical protein